MTQIYTVHLPPEGAPRTIEGADSLVLVKEGISWIVLILPWLWLLVMRMWVPFLVYVAAILAMQVALILSGVPEGVGALCGIVFTLIFALEASQLRRWSLRRKGWRMIGVTSGRDLEECEAKAIDGWLDGTLPDIEAVEIAASGGQEMEPDVIGLFPEPEPGR